jgi:hypothetical protein
MYPPISKVRPTLRLGLMVLVDFALSACGGGGAKDGAEKAATIKTVAGDGGSHLGDGGSATKAGFCGTSDVTLDHKGNIYICDLENQRIRKVDRDGIIHTVAGSGKKGYSGNGGPATKAALKTRGASPSIERKTCT